MEGEERDLHVNWEGLEFEPASCHEYDPRFSRGRPYRSLPHRPRHAGSMTTTNYLMGGIRGASASPGTRPVPIWRTALGARHGPPRLLPASRPGYPNVIAPVALVSVQLHARHTLFSDSPGAYGLTRIMIYIICCAVNELALSFEQTRL